MKTQEFLDFPLFTGSDDPLVESVTLHSCSLVQQLLQHRWSLDFDCFHFLLHSRAGWLLLNSRSSRHLALTAFCLGVIVYLAGKYRDVEHQFLLLQTLAVLLAMARNSGLCS